MAVIDKQDTRSPMIHEKVAYWATETPDAVAVRSAFETLTYSQMDCESNALADYLSAQGIKAGIWSGFFPAVRVDAGLHYRHSQVRCRVCTAGCSQSSLSTDADDSATAESQAYFRFNEDHRHSQGNASGGR